MIYTNFLHEDDEEKMNTPIWKVIEEAVLSGDEFDEEFSRDEDSENSAPRPSVELSSFIDLTVMVEDVETCEEVELPPIRLIRS